MVYDFMSKDVIYGYLSDEVTTISKLFRENDIGFLPIMDNDKLYGVITDRDVALNIGKSLSEFVCRRVICVDEDCSMEEAASLMARNKVKRLCVVHDGDLVGVLSLCDCFGVVDDSKLFDVFKDIFVSFNERIDSEVDDFPL